MKSKLLLTLVCAIFCATSAMAAEKDVAADAKAIASAEQSTKKLSDGAITDIVKTLNKNEIASAKAAIKKATDPKVKEYAEFLLKEHKENLKEVGKLGKMKFISPELAKMLKHEGKDEMKDLAKLKGAEFDKAYVAAMVKDHEQAISLFNDVLLKDVTDPKLKEFLETTRGHLETHLEKAKKLQG